MHDDRELKMSWTDGRVPARCATVGSENGRRSGVCGEACTVASPGGGAVLSLHEKASKLLVGLVCCEVMGSGCHASKGQVILLLPTLLPVLPQLLPVLHAIAQSD